MRRLNQLNLANTGLTQWPIGAETLTRLEHLLLQENLITEIPDAVFTEQRLQVRNRNTLLHDNPLASYL